MNVMPKTRIPTEDRYMCNKSKKKKKTERKEKESNFINESKDKNKLLSSRLESVKLWKHAISCSYD